jgi:hypothetical protein
MGLFKKAGKYLKNRTRSILGKEPKAETKTVVQEPDPNQELSREMDAYGRIDSDALAGAEADSKRAGTFAETKEFRQGLESEGGARARGLKFAAQQRINALRARLGLPASPAGTI